MRYITIHGYNSQQHATLINVAEITMVGPGPAVVISKDEINQITNESLKLDFALLDKFAGVVGEKMIAELKEKKRADMSSDGGHSSMSIVTLRDGTRFGAMETVDQIVEKLDEVSEDEYREDCGDY